MRITGSDAEGQAQLDNLIDPESAYPVLVTTSRLLSTGVDAQTCRLIVLDREIGSMTEFKQIVGRGTRIHEDTGKYYFAIMDFRGATNHFADPDFDGGPVQVYEPGEDDPVRPDDTASVDEEHPTDYVDDNETILFDPSQSTDTDGKGEKREKIYVDGVSADIVAERVEYLDANGRLVTESLRDFTKQALRQRFASLDDFLHRWRETDRKQAIVDELNEQGLPLEAITREIDATLDPFDLICHVAFGAKPLTRRERADNVRKQDVFNRYGERARVVLDALLDIYADEGVLSVDDTKVLKIPPLSQMGTATQLVRAFGGETGFEQAVHEMQSALYADTA